MRTSKRERLVEALLDRDYCNVRGDGICPWCKVRGCSAKCEIGQLREVSGGNGYKIGADEGEADDRRGVDGEGTLALEFGREDGIEEAGSSTEGEMDEREV